MRSARITRGTMNNGESKEGSLRLARARAAKATIQYEKCVAAREAREAAEKEAKENG